MSKLDRFPVNPQRFPFFYGWLLVPAATLGVLSSIPGQTMGVSVFTPHLATALGLTSEQLSLAYLFGTLTSGLLLVRGGSLVDRFGVRSMNTMAAIALGLSLLYLSISDEIVDALEILTGAEGSVLAAVGVAFFGFFCIRFSGQGMLAMIPRVMLGKWFDRRRGMAMGVYGVLVSFGFGCAPLFLNELIGMYGWRGAYQVMAFGVGVFMAAAGWVFFRERPQDFGLEPDGVRRTAEDHEPVASKRIVREFTLSEARRSYAFWVFTLGLGTHGLVVTAVTFHIIPLTRAAGLAEETGLAIFLPMSILSVCSNLITGRLADKIELRHILQSLLVMQAFGTFGFLNFSEFWGRALAVTGHGIAGGTWGILMGVTWPRYFGTQHLGRITGQNMSIMVVLTATAPILFAIPYERLGSFFWGIAIALALPLIVLVMSIPVQNPQHRASRIDD